jgi:hypothetical protein
MKLEKYSFGVGDRFGHQGKAQLRALIKAKQNGLDVVPVWNKSYREHTTIGTTPLDVRKEADQAVKDMNWTSNYYVDADHINFSNISSFIEHSDFFTLDVAEAIGQPCDSDCLDSFVKFCDRFACRLTVDNIDSEFDITHDTIRQIGSKYLHAVKQASKVYRHLVDVKGQANFIAEVSMDETDSPQTPLEMFFILAAIAMEGIDAQTIAPKFTGRFNKGVDYVGDVTQFEKEFIEDVAIVDFAVKEFGLPDNLKLSVHSGSDKFSIYGPIQNSLKKFDAGLHLKTAGTTWLEELIGLAEAGGDGLEVAKLIYRTALKKFDELCQPYATVIDIDKAKLPSSQTVDKWSGQEYASALCHDLADPAYNLDFRQLLHVGYKVAAEMGDSYYSVLREYEDIIAGHVSENIYTRHLVRVFPASN